MDAWKKNLELQKAENKCALNISTIINYSTNKGSGLIQRIEINRQKIKDLDALML